MSTNNLLPLHEIRARHPKLARPILDAVVRGSVAPSGKNAAGDDVFCEELVTIAAEINLCENEIASRGDYPRRGGGSRDSVEKQYKESAARLGL